MAAQARNKLTCPNCSRVGTTSQDVPVGARIRCPNCQFVYRYQGEADAVKPVPAEPLVAEVPDAPQARTPVGSSRTRDHVAAMIETPVRPAAVPGHPHVQVNVFEPRTGNTLAVASLVLGILAALVCWIPFIGLVAIPVGLLGLLLGTIAITLVIVVKRRGLATAVVGAGLSLAAMVSSFAITGLTSVRLSEALEKSGAKQGGPVAKAVAPKPPQAVVANPGTVQPAPPPKADRGQETKPEPEAVDFPQSASLGDVEVRITRILRGVISLRNLIDSDQHDRSKEPLLSIYLEVKNVGDARKIDYHTFAGTGFGSAQAILKDDLGNRYRAVDFGFTTKPEGRTDSKAVYPNEAVTDQLVFEKPVGKAEGLTLELPAKAVGLEDGTFRFKIPTSAIESLTSD